MVLWKSGKVVCRRLHAYLGVNFDGNLNLVLIFDFPKRVLNNASIRCYFVPDMAPEPRLPYLMSTIVYYFYFAKSLYSRSSMYLNLFWG